MTLGSALGETRAERVWNDLYFRYFGHVSMRAMEININMTTTMIVTVYGKDVEYHRDGEKPPSQLETQEVSENTRV